MIKGADSDVRRLDLRVPAGVSMAQGIPPQLAPYTIKIPSFVVDLDENKPTEFVIPTAPMRLNVRLTRLRRLDP